MTYATQQNLIDRFSEDELTQLTDDNNIGTIDETKINAAISDASAEIDGYLAAYSLPLAVIPELLTLKCCDIARYNLYDDLAPEHIETRYDKAIKFMEKVASGRIGLGVDAVGQQPVAAENAVMESGGRVFGRDDNGFI